MSITRNGSNQWLLHGEAKSFLDLFTAADRDGPQTIIVKGRSYQLLAGGDQDGTKAAEFLSKGGPLGKDDLRD